MEGKGVLGTLIEGVSGRVDKGMGEQGGRSEDASLVHWVLRSFTRFAVLLPK